jgi:hypothetical protein
MFSHPDELDQAINAPAAQQAAAAPAVAPTQYADGSGREFQH